MNKKIITIIGARPQFIKVAPVSLALKKHAPKIQEILVHTGQHYDDNMSKIFFDELAIEAPKYNLGIGGGLHGEQTGAMLKAIEEVLITEKPKMVLIYGDTNSTLAGALAATKLHIPVAHVEAGMRSFNRKMPEEINRVVADHLSSLLFVPSLVAVNNLLAEGIALEKIHNVGDVMYDAVLHFSNKVLKKNSILHSLKLQKKQYLLATIHRAENTDDPKRLEIVFSALAKLSNHYPVVIPLHPRTKAALLDAGLMSLFTPDIKIIEPQGYFEMLDLEKHAKLVITDSGGVQKEAFYLGVPCATLRDETEWVELIASGWNHLIPPLNAEDIYTKILELFAQKPEAATYPYGTGDAALKIVEVISEEVVL